MYLLYEHSNVCFKLVEESPNYLMV